MTTAKKSYDFELLQRFCQENKIELLQDYGNQKLKKSKKSKENVSEKVVIHVFQNV